MIHAKTGFMQNPKIKQKTRNTPTCRMLSGVVRIEASNKLRGGFRRKNSSNLMWMILSSQLVVTRTRTKNLQIHVTNIFNLTQQRELGKEFGF